MTASLPSPNVSASLVDALDHLLNQGAVLVGEATLSLGGVDLIYVGLNLLISSVETLRAAGVTPRPPLGPSGDAGRKGVPPQGDPQGGEPDPRVNPMAGREEVPATDFRLALEPASTLPEPEVPERADQGLARLVLTLVELLRQLIERQALRRMEGGSLSDAQLERMGLALRDLAGTMKALCEAFGLQQEELNVDLGPLGRLLDDGR